MHSNILMAILLTLSSSINSDSFKEEQLKYPRVRQAYKDKEVSVLSLLAATDLKRDKIEVYIRAFKHEKEIELWGKNSIDDEYKLIKVHDVCQTSGNLGPKRQQGDLQIPEGFYHIDRFNPYSNFYLSLGVNYPNRSDQILGVRNNLGGDIFIHGACVTIGCLPITDDLIKELYIFCVEARNNGQIKIPVTIFPFKLSDETFAQLSEKYHSKDKLELWSDLKLGFDLFNQTKKLPQVRFLSSGRHQVTAN